MTFSSTVCFEIPTNQIFAGAVVRPDTGGWVLEVRLVIGSYSPSSKHPPIAMVMK